MNMDNRYVTLQIWFPYLEELTVVLLVLVREIVAPKGCCLWVASGKESLQEVVLSSFTFEDIS